jgi:hypothetical protein
VALADCLGPLQFALVTVECPLGFARLPIDLAVFDKQVLRLVVFARRGLVARAFVARGLVSFVGYRAMITGIRDSMMMWRVAPPKIIWRMRLCV